MTAVNELLIKAVNLQNEGQAAEAAKLFWQVLAAFPSNPVALYSLSVIALHSGDLTEALRLSQQGIAASPSFAPMRFVHGAALQAAGQREEALRNYDAALEIDPRAIDVLLNSGVLLREMLRHQEALERFNRILEIDPNHAAALGNCAIILTEFKQSEPAIARFEKLLEISPDYDYGLGLLTYERLHICNWTDFERMSERIIAGVRVGKRACKSLALMAISDSASDQLQAARTFAQHHCPRRSDSLWQGERYRHDKIRLAYVSPDLREHPVGHLIAGVFEHHDKSRFETFAISLGIDDQSRLRARMLKAFDRFIDVRDMGAAQIAQLMRELEIDIAVDLGGYTSDTRTDIFAHRPAPIQINYLGYPGSMGTDYYDYILADRHVIPEEHQQFYSEKVIYLPDTYLPTDESVKISARTPTRSECGLPETGIVFCSFSHDYKISPPLFDVWMHLLDRVPGSVLWLISRNELSQRNLRKEAEARGIDPSRLVFASRVPLVEDHLARYRQADLFLDTHPYNAHTTAADALMAGLPVVTYMGKAFPSRVAGSLLHAIGLEELVTESLADYQSLALSLALDPVRLADIKTRLAANRLTHALFDTDRFCRNLEDTLVGLHSDHPHLTISPSPKDTEIHTDLGITLTLVDGVQMVVPNSLNLITPYVLQEQRDWFEDEIKFLRQLLQPGQKVIDIGANYGVYTLSMAQTVGPSGCVWAFEPASSTAKFLARGIAANGFEHVVLERSALSSTSGTAQLSLNGNSELNALVRGIPAANSSETVPLTTLDECLERYGWRGGIEFMKIDAEGEEENILKGGRQFFRELSPLVQYEIKAGKDLKMELANQFAALGYESYRLVPGLELLAPFDAESIPDDYLLNLFCCKQDRAERLAARGLLIDSAIHFPAIEQEAFGDILAKLRNSDAYNWRRNIAKLPYGARLANRWERTMATVNRAAVDEALSLFALSQDTSLSPTERCRALAASLSEFKTLCESQPSHLRLASLARVAQDFGARSLAVWALQQLSDTIHLQDPDEPFLAPGQRFDSIAPGADIGNWVLAAALEELERLGSYSSFYTGIAAQQRLEKIHALGFGSDEMERRLNLLHQRFGLPHI